VLTIASVRSSRCPNVGHLTRLRVLQQEVPRRHDRVSLSLDGVRNRFLLPIKIGGASYQVEVLPMKRKANGRGKSRSAAKRRASRANVAKARAVLKAYIEAGKKKGGARRSQDRRARARS